MKYTSSSFKGNATSLSEIPWVLAASVKQWDGDRGVESSDI